MAQSYGPVYLHIVFSTKHRENLLSREIHTEFARNIHLNIIARNQSKIIRMVTKKDGKEF